jgi:5-methyltetrahydropteroyltriglutamate--homocysteine methyltransferase
VGAISADELREVEDDCVRDVVAMQRDIGLQSATDGEFRRSAWHMDFIYSLGGVTQADEKLHVQFFNDSGTLDFAPAALRISDRIRLKETIFAEHFGFLQKAAGDGVTPKLTIPSPSMVHYRGGRAAIDPTVYPDLEEFWDDLTAAYSEQVRRIGDLGCTYLQLDDTSLAYLNDPRQRELIASLGGDREHQHELYIRNLNRVMEAKPSTMRITTHMCRGNFQSSWAAEGGYDFVAEALFGQLAVDGFFLEYDDARSGGFEPLRFVPPDKYVVLGLVTTKRGALESKDDLKRRIEEATKYIALEQLCLSPQCGFSSTFEGNVLTYDDEVAKLALIVETAEEVWG